MPQFDNTKKIRVAIVDDDSESLASKLSWALPDCYVHLMTLNHFRLLGPELALSRYDCIFVDATYERTYSDSKKLSALDIVESKPKLYPICRVMIGLDIAEYAYKGSNYSDLHNFTDILRRVYQLPHIEHGKHKGSKAQQIQEHILSIAREKGVPCRRRSFDDSLSPDFKIKSQQTYGLIQGILSSINELQNHLQNTANLELSDNDLARLNNRNFLENSKALSQDLLPVQHMLAQAAENFRTRENKIGNISTDSMEAGNAVTSPVHTGFTHSDDDQR